MITEVWSGGQCGADISGLRAAKRAGIPTGGWMPRGWRTIAGPKPEYAGMYGLKQHASWNYADRTAANVRDSDATLIIAGNPSSVGTLLTRRHAEEQGKRFIIVSIRNIQFEAELGFEIVQKAFLSDRRIQRLNIAGNRSAPEDLVEAWLYELFCRANGTGGAAFSVAEASR